MGWPAQSHPLAQGLGVPSEASSGLPPRAASRRLASHRPSEEPSSQIQPCPHHDPVLPSSEEVPRVLEAPCLSGDTCFSVVAFNSLKWHHFNKNICQLALEKYPLVLSWKKIFTGLQLSMCGLLQMEVLSKLRHRSIDVTQL